MNEVYSWITVFMSATLSFSSMKILVWLWVILTHSTSPRLSVLQSMLKIKVRKFLRAWIQWNITFQFFETFIVISFTFLDCSLRLLWKGWKILMGSFYCSWPWVFIHLRKGLNLKSCDGNLISVDLFREKWTSTYEDRPKSNFAPFRKYKRN